MSLYASMGDLPAGRSIACVYGRAMWHLTLSPTRPLKAVCGRNLNTAEGGRARLCKMCVAAISPPEET